MSEAIASWFRFGLPKVAQPKADIELPKPQPFGAPMFIADAVTPLAGETVLSLLMKRMAAEADADQT